MEAMEQITGRIRQDAQKQVDQIRQRAEKDAADIAAHYADMAAQESRRILDRGRQAADERLNRVASSAALERRKLELAAKQQLLEDAFTLALDKLKSLPDGERVSLLADLAAGAAGTGREEVILSPSERDAVGPAVVQAANERLARRRPDIAAALTLSAQTRPISGGLILSDGEVEVNCAFDTLVSMQREPLEKEVAALLFGT